MNQCEQCHHCWQETPNQQSRAHLDRVVALLRVRGEDAVDLAADQAGLDGDLAAVTLVPSAVPSQLADRYRVRAGGYDGLQQRNCPGPSPRSCQEQTGFCRSNLWQLIHLPYPRAAPGLGYSPGMLKRRKLLPVWLSLSSTESVTAWPDRLVPARPECDRHAVLRRDGQDARHLRLVVDLQLRQSASARNQKRSYYLDTHQ